MRYYCESKLESINHVTPGILMLDSQIQERDINLHPPQTILDLGCGNGRNSLYLAKKYNTANVVLVDSDVSMLGWAQQVYSLQGLPAKTVCTTIEELASDPLTFNEKMGVPKFDIVIFSYVVQHIDPVYYPIILDFCRQVSKSYIVIDVFWNPSRLRAGEFTKIGSVNWYGLTYEELVTFIAPRFQILNDRVLKTDIAVVINMALAEGQTPLRNILKRNYEYYSDRIKRYGYQGTDKIIRHRVKTINIDGLQCVKFLSSLYPSEFDFVKTELTQWMQNSTRLTPASMAAKFLWLCRTNKIPVMLNEVSRDFGVSIGRIKQTMMSDADYLPSLGTSDYIGRIAKQFGLHSNIEEHAIDIAEDNSFESTTPVIRACCAVIKAGELIGMYIHKAKLAYAFNISTVGINSALKRTRYHRN